MNEIAKREDGEIIEVGNFFYDLTPQQKIEKASEMAKVLQAVVKQAKLAKNFGGKKDHLEYEAWQTIGQFFGCTPATEWTRPIKEADSIVGWEASVAVYNTEGRIVGRAESMCMKDERNWKDKPNYALRSMAQTRAASKALRSIFAFVAVLAGYAATPLEEVDDSFSSEKDTKDQQTLPKDSGLRKKIDKKIEEFAETGISKEKFIAFLGKAGIITQNEIGEFSLDTISVDNANHLATDWNQYISDFIDDEQA